MVWYVPENPLVRLFVYLVSKYGGVPSGTLGTDGALSTPWEGPLKAAMTETGCDAVARSIRMSLPFLGFGGYLDRSSVSQTSYDRPGPARVN